MIKSGGNQDVNYSLISAFRKGRVEIARELINSFGLSYSQEWSEGYVLLRDAVVNNHAEVAKLLLTSGSRVNSNDRKPANTPLHFAVINGDIEIVNMIINKGANIEAKNQYGSTPLHHAITNKNMEVTELLLKHRADVDARDYWGRNALHIAAETGCLPIVEHLLKYGVTVDCVCTSKLTPLHVATKAGHETLVKLLLEHGSKVDSQDEDSKTVLYFAVEKGNSTIVKEVLKYCPDINDKSNRSSFNIAVRGHGVEYKNIVEALLEYGLMVSLQDKNDPELLHAAVEKGYLKIIEDLLKYGADVNMYYSKYYFEEDFTPLHSAAKYKREEVAKLLISYGADINAQDKTGKTPIFYAIENADLKITKLLLQHDANVNFKDEFGRTALHAAGEKGHYEFVEFLLEYGADINVTNSDNDTPLEIALAEMEKFYDFGYDYYYPEHGDFEMTIENLKRHIVKMKTANLYVSKKNLLSMRNSDETDEFSDFKDECEKEIASMKSEKINNLNTSFYDILAKSASSLATYMRNENIVQVLKSDDYKTKFPIYARMVQCNFKKGMARIELLEQGYKISHFLFNNFPELPYDCTEKIFSYLSDEDLRILINACKPLGVCNPN